MTVDELMVAMMLDDAGPGPVSVSAVLANGGTKFASGFCAIAEGAILCLRVEAESSGRVRASLFFSRGVHGGSSRTPLLSLLPH